MPSALTYPGVYIEEISSGVHTITGVATSIAAFIGWSAKGPTGEAQLISSWADYQRAYGGLEPRGLLGYSVYHFFNNGGQKAYILRLLDANKAKPATSGQGDLKFTAKSEGAWANDYGISIKRRQDDTSRFSLSVVYVKRGGNIEEIIEKYDNLSVDPNDSRFVEGVVSHASAVLLVTVKPGGKPPAADTPAATSAKPTPSTKLEGGADGDPLEPTSQFFATKLRDVNGAGGYKLLRRVDIFNLLCVPGLVNTSMLSELQGFCRERRALLIADCEQKATYSDLQKAGGPNSTLTGDNSMNAAFYFPWVKAPDPLDENRQSDFPPCGFVAGLYAKTDTNRGVWKAPAGTEASLVGISGVSQPLTDLENGELNIRAINCIRTLPVYGPVLWGSRTLQGSDERGSEWKYVPVRRTALFIEETLYRNLKWVVFESNDEPLWSQIRLNVGAFMHDLFRQHAFQGMTPREAYFVKCDRETTTQNDIDHGIVNILVGFAPLKPAEFVLVKIQQIAGQIET